MWPMTGISAPMIFSIMGRRLRPPSSFTDWAPDRISRAALFTVSDSETW